MHADSKRSFWEARYSKSEGTFDWYQVWQLPVSHRCPAANSCSPVHALHCCQLCRRSAHYHCDSCSPGGSSVRSLRQLSLTMPRSCRCLAWHSDCGCDASSSLLHLPPALPASCSSLRYPALPEMAFRGSGSSQQPQHAVVSRPGSAWAAQSCTHWSAPFDDTLCPHLYTESVAALCSLEWATRSCSWTWPCLATLGQSSASTSARQPLQT